MLYPMAPTPQIQLCSPIPACPMAVQGSWAASWGELPTFPLQWLLHRNKSVPESQDGSERHSPTVLCAALLVTNSGETWGLAAACCPLMNHAGRRPRSSQHSATSVCTVFLQLLSRNELTTNLFLFCFSSPPFNPSWSACLLNSSGTTVCQEDDFPNFQVNNKKPQQTSKEQQTPSCEQGTSFSGHRKDLIYCQLPSGYFTFMGWG